MKASQYMKVTEEGIISNAGYNLIMCVTKKEEEAKEGVGKPSKKSKSLYMHCKLILELMVGCPATW